MGEGDERGGSEGARTGRKGREGEKGRGGEGWREGKGNITLSV